MLEKTIVNSPKGPQPVGPYSHAIKVGNLLFLSGQIPLDPVSGQLAAADIKNQTESILHHIQNILAEEKLTLDHVIKTTVFMTDLNEFAQMNEVYARFFARQYPARSTIQVAALPKGAKIEIEAIAWCESPH